VLGLHPGLGGTVRFRVLVNPDAGDTLMLSGKTIGRAKGKVAWLVDA